MFSLSLPFCPPPSSPHPFAPYRLLFQSPRPFPLPPAFRLSSSPNVPIFLHPRLLCPLCLCSVVIIPPPGHLTADNRPRRKKKKKKRKEAQFLSAATAAIHCRVVNGEINSKAPPHPLLLFFPPSPPLSVNAASYSWCCRKSEKRTHLNFNAPSTAAFYYELF